MPGPSDKLPLELVNVVVPEHAPPNGRTVGTNVVRATAGIAVDTSDTTEVYVASKPAPFTAESDVKTTYTWLLDDVTERLVVIPVTTASRGADEDAPSYTLTKS